MENQEELFEQWRKDPANWKWGMFYFNPQDKRIFPPKRIKSMGYTVNFANLKSVAFLIFFIAFTVFVVSMISVNKTT